MKIEKIFITRTIDTWATREDAANMWKHFINSFARFISKKMGTTDIFNQARDTTQNKEATRYRFDFDLARPDEGVSETEMVLMDGWDTENEQFDGEDDEDGRDNCWTTGVGVNVRAGTSGNADVDGSCFWDIKDGLAMLVGEGIDWRGTNKGKAGGGVGPVRGRTEDGGT